MQSFTPHIVDKEKPLLKALLELNEEITTIYILEDSLKKLWRYSYTTSCENSLRQWYSIARESAIHSVIDFAKMLTWYSYGLSTIADMPFFIPVG